MGLATSGSGSQKHGAPCPVLSWQLARGAGGAPPKQARAGRARSVLGQGGDGADAASLGLVWPRWKVEGQLGGIPFVMGAVCLCLLTLIIARVIDLLMHLSLSLYAWIHGSI